MRALISSVGDQDSVNVARLLLSIGYVVLSSSRDAMVCEAGRVS
jgi:hypothetical protein